MIVARTFDELQAALTELRRDGKTVSFVPTMGALHSGHLSLVNIARSRAECVAVSIFVNPTQFGPKEDFRAYPRTPGEDCKLLEREGVDLVFVPTAAMMYPAGSFITVDPGPVGNEFEGRSRPGHFRGVLTVVAKLFHLIKPNAVVFGQKDAQQLFLVRRMAVDLNIPVQIIEGETVREPDGLALSSRNAYLKVAERQKATVLFRALGEGERLYEAGIRSLDKIQAAMREVLRETPEFEPDYATAVDESDFVERSPLPDEARLIIAGKLGSVRLIDNVPLRTA